MIRFCLLSLLLLMLPLQAGAIDADAPIADEEQRLLYEDLIAEVRCLVCQNQTIGDSTAPLAADLRREIRGMVESGQSEGQIKDFLTERYGEFVLYRPRYTGSTAVLWIAPGALVLLGGVALWRVVRKRASLPVTSEEEDAMDA